VVKIAKILRIDLETKNIEHEDYTNEDEISLIGGMGLATAIFTSVHFAAQLFLSVVDILLQQNRR